MLNLSYTAWSKKEKKGRKKSNHPYLNKQAGKRMMVNHHLGKKDEIFSSCEKKFYEANSISTLLRQYKLCSFRKTTYQWSADYR